MNVFTLKRVFMTGLLIAPLLKTGAQTRAADSTALVNLYNTTSGSSWVNKTNWLSGPISGWYGVTLTDGRVTKLSLPSNGLSGTYPNLSNALTAVTEINLSNNSLTGGIGWMSNANLQVLNLSNNKLSGSFPGWNTLTGIKTINLSSNSLSGEFKDYWFPALEYMDLSNNQFSGSLPWPNDATVKTYNVSHNQFTGSIHAFWNGVPNLTSYDVSYNKLTGGMPAWTTMAAVTHMNVSHNNLSGDLANFGLPSIQVLDFSYNKLTSNIPTYSTNPIIYANNNKYTFAQLESRVGSLQSGSAYAPQDTILPLQFSSGQLSVSAGGTLAKNTYKWYLNAGTLVGTTVGNSSFTPTQAGDYYVEVTNSDVSSLNLTSTTVSITTLPVTLLSFKATVQPNSVKLVWETADEQQLDYFAVERSADGENWSVIGTVKSKSSEISPAEKLGYYYDDNAYPAAAAISYYRLKQVDNDGLFKYSEVEWVKHTLNSPTASISVYPNPSLGNWINVEFPEVSGLITQFKVTDAAGRVLKTVSVPANTHSLQLNHADLAAGLYHIIWPKSNQKYISTTFIVQ